MANPDRNILATSYFPLLGSSTGPTNGFQAVTPGHRQSQGWGAHVTHTNGQMNPSPVQVCTAQLSVASPMLHRLHFSIQGISSCFRALLPNAVPVESASPSRLVKFVTGLH